MVNIKPPLYFCEILHQQLIIFVKANVINLLIIVFLDILLINPDIIFGNWIFILHIFLIFIEKANLNIFLLLFLASKQNIYFYKTMQNPLIFSLILAVI